MTKEEREPKQRDINTIQIYSNERNGGWNVPLSRVGALKVTVSFSHTVRPDPVAIVRVFTATPPFGRPIDIYIWRKDSTLLR